MKARVIIFFAALISCVAQAQILKITETSAKKPIVLNSFRRVIVDINGELKVQVNKDSLASLLESKSNPAMTHRLQSMVHLLRAEKDILTILTPAIPGSAADISKLNKYSEMMGNFLAEVAKDAELRTRLNALYDQGAELGDDFDTLKYPTLDTYVIKNLVDDMTNLRDEINRTPDVASTTIQVMAFLSTKAESDRRVHVENFDNYAAGDFFEVQRWVTSLSEDDIKSFHQMEQLSDSLNRQIETNFAGLKKLIPSTFSSIDCFSKLVIKIKQEANSTGTEVPATVKTFLSQSEKKISAVLLSLQNILLQKNNKGVNALEGFNEAQAEFLTLAKTLASDVEDLKNKLVDREKQQVAGIVGDFQNCVVALKQDIATVSKVFNVVTSMLAPFKQTANVGAVVAGEAFSFSLDKLPGFGLIDLKTTGHRENGDKIVIKLVARTTDEVNKNIPGRTLESRSIILQQINFYSETNIGVVLAFPVHRNENVTLPSRSQFAPSGSLLLKFGFRNSMFWNSINPGIGFNISTPDFNVDGAPDVSYGGVITLFRNVATIGYSYNAKTNSPFWFVGLSLPFATLGLPLGDVETQKMK